LQRIIKYNVFFSAVRMLLLCGIMVPVVIFIAAEAFAYTDLCGHTWTQHKNAGLGSNNYGQGYWWRIVSSDNGTSLAAIEYGGYIYTSGDGGDSWTKQINAGQRPWYSIASSADGSRLAAVDSDGSYLGHVWTSNDYGVTWSNDNVTFGSIIPQSVNWVAISSSGNGKALHALDYDGNVFNGVSADGGNWTWTEIDNATFICKSTIPRCQFYSIATSHDGSLVVVGTTNEFLYESANGGTSWTRDVETTDEAKRYWWSLARPLLISSEGGASTPAVFGVDGVGGNVVPEDDETHIVNMGSTNLTSISWSDYLDENAGTQLYFAVTDFGFGGSGGYIYTTPTYDPTHGFGTWTKEAGLFDKDNATKNVSKQQWSSIAAGTYNDEIMLAATTFGGYIYTRTQDHPSFPVIIDNSTGTGKGTVYSSSGPIAWGPPVSNSTNIGTAIYACPNYITLTAIPNTVGNDEFDGWTGCDNSTSGAKCTLMMTSAKNISAVFGNARTDHVMTVAVTTDNGTVTSSPTGIYCTGAGNSCNSNFPDNYTVTLSATPDTGYYSSWTGCDNATGYQCFVTMLSNKSVSVAFAAAAFSYSLSVSETGSGTGTITSSPSGISCGSNCSFTYTSGTSVTLTATPDAGSSFLNWTGCDSTNGSQCTVSVSSDRSVSAAFTAGPLSYTLFVAKTGVGTGTVASYPSGISCGSVCSSSFSTGAAVILTAVPGAGFSLSGWTGCDITSGSQCTVTMSSNKTVSAAFSQSAEFGTAASGLSSVYSQYAALFGAKSGSVTAGTSASGTYYVQWFTNGTAIIAWTDGYIYYYPGSGSSMSMGITWKTTSDSALAAMWINSFYSQYASFFGTASGGVTAGATANGTYYIQWYTNGSAIVAWTDGYMYSYYAGNTYPFSMPWKIISANDRASAGISQVYSQHASYFGTVSGGVVTVSSWNGTYYIQWFANGTALLAGADGYMYAFDGTNWYSSGVTWQTTTLYDKASSKINSLYSLSSGYFGIKYGSITGGAMAIGTYYIQWFMNGSAIIAWTDGNMYYADSTGSWHSFGTTWK
ncbi:MAG: exo-alpha-sialidase, partial [Nitrospirae bacterium]|nr:exo-alpha-sialidase [Nitrospirota bacterium]